MAKKKTVKRKRRTATRRKKKPALKGELIKAFAGLGILILLVVGIAVGVRYGLIGKGTEPTADPRKVQVPVKRPKMHKVHKAPARNIPPKPPAYEIYPQREIPHYKPAVPPAVPRPEKKPAVAIIIDDLGYDPAIADKFADLEAVLTFSVLPYSPFHERIVKTAQRKGFDVMLHLPMEPVEYPRIDPGPGALLMDMAPDALIDQLRENLSRVPHIKGVNNHMGSRMTAASERMNQVFSVLKQRHLFFIDSRTTADTVSAQSARLFKVPFAQRDVFLDHIQTPAHVRRQIEKLIRYAEAHGSAVGIGHPHAVTYEVLRQCLPQLRARTVLVPASRIVHIAG